MEFWNYISIHISFSAREWEWICPPEVGFAHRSVGWIQDPKSNDPYRQKFLDLELILANLPTLITVKLLDLHFGLRLT